MPSGRYGASSTVHFGTADQAFLVYHDRRARQALLIRQFCNELTGRVRAPLREGAAGWLATGLENQGGRNGQGFDSSTLR